MKILAIETSCDETAASIVVLQPNQSVWVVSHVLNSSLQQHIQTGGVVPEVAARSQLESIIPVVHQALLAASGQESASTSPQESQSRAINFAHTQVDALAVTQGPGLIGSLLVGVETAKALSLAWQKPLIPVNHLLGHVYANWISPELSNSSWKPPQLPALALIVSGGHTEILLFNEHGQYQLLGGTRDDAVGECFDKCGRAIDLPYPGGPEISRLASLYHSDKAQADQLLPRPLLYDDSLDFSFSGIKAAFVRQTNHWRKEAVLSQEHKQKLSYALETSIDDILNKKVLQALQRFSVKSFLLCGGVAANQTIRNSLKSTCEQNSVQFYVPDVKYCTDNAAMIGACALFNNHPLDPVEIKPNPGLEL